MSYASEKLGERKVLDADGHLIEPPGWLQDHADPDIRDQLIPQFQLDKKALAQVEKMMPGSIYDTAQPMDEAQRAQRGQENIMRFKNFHALGSFRSEERPRALDLIGVQKQVIFSTNAIAEFDNTNVGAPPDAPRNLDVLYGGARAHNRAMAAFCSSDRRLLATGYVPLEDPERSAHTVDHALEIGCKVLHVSHAVPTERSWSHPDYDLVWERIAKSGRPMVLHVGAGDKTLDLPRAVYNNGRETHWLIGDHSWQIPDVMTWHWPAQLMLTQMVLDGVFERFPTLRCGVIELRANWVPSFMEQLDFTQFGMYQNPDYADGYRLPLRASDYIRRQVKFTPWASGGDPLATLIDSVEDGERIFLFGSDYPHDEGGLDPIGGFEAELDKLAHRPDIHRIRDLFYHDNFVELFGT